jgi:hypothetical protein
MRETNLRVAKGLTEKVPVELWEAWIVGDGRPQRSWFHESHVTLFNRQSDDPTRSNMESSGCLHSDRVMKVEGIGLRATLPPIVLAELHMGLVLELIVGCKCAFQLHGMAHADRSAIRDDGTAVTSLGDRPVAIPPRQPFYANLTTSAPLSVLLREIETRYGDKQLDKPHELRVSLFGTLLRERYLDAEGNVVATKHSPMIPAEKYLELKKPFIIDDYDNNCV